MISFKYKTIQVKNLFFLWPPRFGKSHYGGTGDGHTQWTTQWLVNLGLIAVLVSVSSSKYPT